jgi:hypothetical protein
MGFIVEVFEAVNEVGSPLFGKTVDCVVVHGFSFSAYLV